MGSTSAEGKRCISKLLLSMVAVMANNFSVHGDEGRSRAGLSLDSKNVLIMSLHVRIRRWTLENRCYRKAEKCKVDTKSID